MNTQSMYRAGRVMPLLPEQRRSTSGVVHRIAGDRTTACGIREQPMSDGNGGWSKWTVVVTETTCRNCKEAERYGSLPGGPDHRIARPTGTGWPPG